MEIIETIDNGESIVQIAKLGTVVGSDKDGNSVEQNFSEQAFEKIVESSKDKEYLVDKDHQSLRNPLEKDTTAMGFISELEVKKGVGLFGKIKWSDIGRKLIQNRVFRWLSPVFKLNSETREPAELVNVAITNMPSQPDLKPIINTSPNEILTDEKDILLMNKEELREMITSIISEMKEAEKTEEIKEEIKEEVIENECSDEMKDVVANEETTEEISEEKTEEVVEETTNEVPVEETKKIEEEEEVIKIESLNSAPNISIAAEPEWKKLKGKEFFDWLAKHPRG